MGLLHGLFFLSRKLMIVFSLSVLCVDHRGGNVFKKTCENANLSLRVSSSSMAVSAAVKFRV